MLLAEMFQEETAEEHDAGGRSLIHEAQICSQSRRTAAGPEDQNRPEDVRRRLSVQLPILHMSYLPIIGGVSTSSSSLFSSQEVFVYNHDNFLFA
ncbi:gamma-aminobutyric acid type B receptor subunit 2 [Kryptolebias marmoratus]|uniref:gamma-aminobutyric acid type B receptor subunit 2 n=1 Tax=Kryptolebias marmoratus TaxID=37003 RepID=UPI0018AC99B9|nr:gamma-aminobutyric acid type B receptor subunit 2 [Kryptolebias marmoratus]